MEKKKEILRQNALTAHIGTCHGYRGATVVQSHCSIYTKDCKKKKKSEQTEKGLFPASRANTNNGLRLEVLAGAQ